MSRINHHKIIYIRHGEDKRENYRDDAELTDSGRHAARELAEHLLQEYGVPDMIYYSPFQRTRATKNEFVEVIKRYKRDHNIDKKVKAVIEPRLGRYFSRRERESPEVHPKSLKKGALIWEDKKQFKRRILDHLDDLPSEKTIWNITHTLVLLKVAKNKGVQRSSYVKYLDYLLIE